MLSATTPAASVSSAPRTNGIDNRQVLEFLELIRELNELAAVLAIQPAPVRRSKAPRDKKPAST